MKDEIRPAWIDRDISWLEFNRRVLHEALDDRTPLLERVKFLAIFSSNLDEFFMKRMASVRQSSDEVGGTREGHTLVNRKREMIVSMLAEQAACFTDVLRPLLAEHGIHLQDWGDLSDGQREEVSTVFDREISPVLTPLSLDAAHPFPYVSNLSTSWAFRLEDPVRNESVLVRVKVPSELPQWLPVHAEGRVAGRVFVGLDQVIQANATKLFPGMVVGSASLFRVCRDAEVDLDEAGHGIRAQRAVSAHLRERVRDECVARLHDVVRDRRLGQRVATRPALDTTPADRARGRGDGHLLRHPQRRHSSPPSV